MVEIEGMFGVYARLVDTIVFYLGVKRARSSLQRMRSVSIYIEGEVSVGAVAPGQ